MAITKLDGTAKGGVVIGISDQFKIPVKYIGLGEGMEACKYSVKMNSLIPCLERMHEKKENRYYHFRML